MAGKGGNRKHGRWKRCASNLAYKSENRRIKNKYKNMSKHILHNPNDEQAKNGIKNIKLHGTTKQQVSYIRVKPLNLYEWNEKRIQEEVLRVKDKKRPPRIVYT